ncbi:MAG: hypothetical protein GTN94_33350 [Candidatus Aminicenantes bacterium]|nr:hypothetical protein [Candidatus Aminicenantes bacterium]
MNPYFYHFLTGLYLNIDSLYLNIGVLYVNMDDLYLFLTGSHDVISLP